MIKKIIAIMLALVFVFAFASCDKQDENKDNSNNSGEVQNTDKGGNKTDKTISITAVVAGSLGDRSFYDSAADGLERLKADYGLKTNVLECKEDASMYQTQLANAAETSDFVVAVGWQFYDALPVVAEAMPDTKFIYVDEAVDGVANITNIKYAQNEGSFLAGYAAAKMSETGTIGAVGGEDNDTINDFYAGYKQGAACANPDIKVEIIYAGSFEDPAKGKECALSLYSKGADIVFQVAGKTGEGVFEAAKEVNKYAIGVDSDQKYINEDVIICSMKKEVGKSIYDAVVAFMNDGTFEGGKTIVTNMEQGYIDLGYGEEGAKQQISDELKAELETIKADIISGKIKVDTTRK